MWPLGGRLPTFVLADSICQYSHTQLVLRSPSTFVLPKFVVVSVVICSELKELKDDMLHFYVS